MEIWDAYDREGNKLGYDIVRDEPFEEGVYHKVAEIIVRHKDGSYLAMQRSMEKKGYPGLFEITAGGSILKGEEPVEGAYRELYEETGIKADTLNHVYHIVRDDAHSIYDGYLVEVDCNKKSVVLQEGETMSYRWIPQHEVKEFIASDLHVAGKNSRTALAIK